MPNSNRRPISKIIKMKDSIEEIEESNWEDDEDDYGFWFDILSYN